MVIVQLSGGLGNQLFQYAAARRLASVNRVPLKLDISDFARDPIRTYSLGPLNVMQAFSGPDEAACLKGSGYSSRLLYWKQKFLPFHKRAWLVERHFHFDSAVLLASGNVYMEGFWQSERYFKDIEPILRSELRVMIPPDPVSSAIARDIHRVDAVSVHFRRGDYVSDPRNRLTHDVCSMEYYEQAICMLTEAGVTPHLFIFSDDPDWVQANWKSKHPSTLIKHNVRSPHQDLRLMSLCRHNIIANSSFSWWGAWLNQNPEKIVIAPSKWVNESNIDTRDLLPKEWRRI